MAKINQATNDSAPDGGAGDGDEETPLCPMRDGLDGGASASASAAARAAAKVAHLGKFFAAWYLQCNIYLA